MSKFFKILRNNWKKSTFGFLACTLAVHYGKIKYNEIKLMEIYCREALEYGKQSLLAGAKPRSITVILNPAANKHKAKANFEKYSAPLLHLAGVGVELVQTQHEGHATEWAEQKNEYNTEALIVAGGDGTLSETVTGLLRRPDAELFSKQKYPLGIIPLGKINSFGEKLFHGLFENKVDLIANATMAIIKNNIKPCDVMKIKVIEENNETNTDEKKSGPKPVFSLSGIEWGIFRDANAIADKYWYWGSLNRHISYVFTGLRSFPKVCWNCLANIQYTLPCSGCSKCYETLIPSDNKEIKSRSWFSFSFYMKENEQSKNLIKMKSINNEECGKLLEKKISTSNITAKLSNSQEKSFIEINLARHPLGYFEYVSEGWERLNGENNHIMESIQAQKLNLFPNKEELNEEEPKHWISIDNEAYELKSLEVILLPKKIHFFYDSLKDSSNL